MSQKLGSKLAGSLRQAKANQPDKDTTSAVSDRESAPTRSTPKATKLFMPSRRVWPD